MSAAPVQGPLQREDTHHGLEGMGWRLVPKSRAQGEPCPNVRFSASACWQPRCGLGTPAHPKQSMMRFYSQQLRFYGGIGLHARTISLCVLDAGGQLACEATVAASPDTGPADLVLSFVT